MNYQIPHTSGCPQPYGPSRTPDGINFAIFSRHATAVTLVLSLTDHNSDTDKSQTIEIDLDKKINKTGDIWHILILWPITIARYGYKLSGPFDPQGNGLLFNENSILIDPYAKALHTSTWGDNITLVGSEPLCLIPSDGYNWENDRPLSTPVKDSIIYELHVRGFTCHQSSGVHHPGTFAGVAEKAGYLKKLGVTAVELMPVAEFNENESIFVNPISGENLKNYWGYSPISFFAPKSAYCVNPRKPLDEFRDMIKTLHKAGIEVILDIVFNHTAEGGLNGPISSFKGIDNTIYYLLDPWTKAYLNFSGCGNTFNCNHPIVRTLIMDALRWWVVEMHVDGFRFDLASILGRDQNGNVLSNPPVVEQIAEDPVLSGSKIIAEAWDAAGLYQVGSFSTHHRWAEWNGRFRDDVRSFMCGNPGTVPALATRIAGSSDLYQHSDKSPCNSINLITSHDGFTLLDLVSYNYKHNMENGENNLDGDNHNLSWNSGIEGETSNRKIIRLRRTRIRTMAVILFISQGIPMLVAGDEFGRTQHGNNNAYCQDNETSWLNWEYAKKNSDLLRFFRKLIQLRREHPIFRKDLFFIDHGQEDEHLHKQEIIWQGETQKDNPWSHEAKILSFILNGSSNPDLADDDFYVMLSGHREKVKIFTVPKPPTLSAIKTWNKIIDTSLASPRDFVSLEKAVTIQPGSRITLKPMSCIVLQTKHKQEKAKKTDL